MTEEFKITRLQMIKDAHARAQARAGKDIEDETPVENLDRFDDSEVIEDGGHIGTDVVMKVLQE
jgi:hypothetical protein